MTIYVSKTVSCDAQIDFTFTWLRYCPKLLESVMKTEAKSSDIIFTKSTLIKVVGLPVCVLVGCPS